MSPIGVHSPKVVQSLNCEKGTTMPRGGKTNVRTRGSFPCPECGRVFETGQGRGAHRKTIHGVSGMAKRTIDARARAAQQEGTDVTQTPADDMRTIDQIHEDLNATLSDALAGTVAAPPVAPLEEDTTEVVSIESFSNAEERPPAPPVGAPVISVLRPASIKFEDMDDLRRTLDKVNRATDDGGPFELAAALLQFTSGPSLTVEAEFDGTDWSVMVFTADE